MTLDLVIRNGTVVDGTGAPPRPADVGIAGDTVVAVGTVDERGHREIDADGRLVTPGFVDVHTHLDAQLAWDPIASSSCWHGVTSIVVGNCGVTFAPVKPGDHGYLAAMMESVEDIPRDAILGGLPWDWEGYPGYLDWLDRTPKGLHVGGMVGHSPVRYYVMGERALEEGAVPTAGELEAMVTLVRDAVAAGALGFSSSRTLRHRVPDGRFVPGTWAEADELVALAGAVGPTGVLEVAPRFDGDGPAEPRVDTELAWMERVSREAGCAVTFNLTQTREQGDHFRRAIARAKAANDRGARIRPQTSPRFIGLLTGLAHRTPFDAHPAWQALQSLPVAERLAALRDPARRAALVDEARGDRTGLDTFYVLNEPDGTARYDCTPDRSLVAVADGRGVSPVEAFVDLTLETDGALLLSWPLLNQQTDAIAEMLTDPVVMLGLADAGAHVGQTMDASAPTSLLTYWVRERGLMPVEEAVRRLTSDTASVFGIDRGVLAPGAVADVNVIDFDGLALDVPEFRHDFPHGAGRFAQRARGYDHTVVAGEVL
ncbi:MAG: amidohydrolase family protein, partial [Actinobacteria bacterium]|nr:amidohydrolase family protein [Actinomycetota bacterium]